jgi:flavorubredoxin
MQLTPEFPDPLRVAESTYLIRPLVSGGVVPLAMHVSSLVIQGAEPVIVDTGAALFRDEWVEQVFGLVEPADVRWIFLSHDDADHNGNLALALEMCPDALLVTSWQASLHMATDLRLPPERQLWIEDGGTLEIADRRLVAVRPPTFDCPSTRGLLDTSTGLYWASDAFGTPVTAAVDHVDELPADLVEDWSTAYSSLLSPWHTIVDPIRFGWWVDRVAELHPTTITSAHGPVISGPAIGVAIERMRHLPDAALAQPPGPELLKELLAAAD